MKIYEQVLAKINQGDTEAALAILKSIEDRDTQLKILQLLDRDLTPDFEAAGASDLAYQYELLRALFVAQGFTMFLQRQMSEHQNKNTVQRSLRISNVMLQFVNFLSKKPNSLTSTKIKIEIDRED